MKKSWWQIAKDFFCEDNGNGSSVRFVYIFGNIALFVLMFIVIFHKLKVGQDLDLIGLGAYATTIETVLTIGKVYQKGKEQNVSLDQPQ